MHKHFWNNLFRLFNSKKHLNLTSYWRDRARRYGKHSVLNMAHREEEFEVITNYQKQLLLPLLKSQLNGSETIGLDFGCGPGRFTSDLAELICGTAIGVDITPELLEIAPQSSSVSYLTIGTDALPFPDSSFDIIWSCLVLGGIPETRILKTIAEIERVLRPGGLFFYVENVARVNSTSYWFFRNEDTYIQMTAFCQPKVLGLYEDMGQPIAIFSGRKI